MRARHPGTHRAPLRPGAPLQTQADSSHTPGWEPWSVWRTRDAARLWGLAAGGRLGGDLLCLDNVEALVTAIDEVLGPGQGNALLEAVIRTATATSMPLLLTAPLAASTSRWATSVGLRLVLGAATSTQAALAGLPRGVVTGGLAGRGVILDGADTTACQIILRKGPTAAGPDSARGSILKLEPLPARITWEQVPSGTWAVGGDAAAPVALPEHTSVLVAGPPGSGRSTALRARPRYSPQTFSSSMTWIWRTPPPPVTWRPPCRTRRWSWRQPQRRRSPPPSEARSRRCVSARRSSCCGPVCGMPIRPQECP